MSYILRLGVLVFLGTSLLISCNREKMQIPEGILQPEELVPLLVDIHLIDGILHQEKMIRQEKEDSAYFYYANILTKHGISRPLFDSTIFFYSQYPDAFSKIYDDVLAELSKMEGERQKISPTQPDSLY